MIPCTFFQQLFKGYNEVIVLEELVDIDCFVVLVFRVVLDHLGLY